MFNARVALAASGFTDATTPDDLVRSLVRAAEAEGAELFPLTLAKHRSAIVRLSRQAEQLESLDLAVELQTAQDGYAEELGRVTGSKACAHVPPTGVPHVVSPRHSDVSLRDFELSELGTLEINEFADEHPTWCILWTERDEPLAWMEAGVALSKLLLSATARGLSTGVQSQPIEIPMIRARLNQTLLSNMGHAQVLVRIGWPGSPTSLPMHPRRD